MSLIRLRVDCLCYHCLVAFSPDRGTFKFSRPPPDYASPRGLLGDPAGQHAVDCNLESHSSSISPSLALISFQHPGRTARESVTSSIALLNLARGKSEIDRVEVSCWVALRLHELQSWLALQFEVASDQKARCLPHFAGLWLLGSGLLGGPALVPLRRFRSALSAQPSRLLRRLGPRSTCETNQHSFAVSLLASLEPSTAIYPPIVFPLRIATSDLHLPRHLDPSIPSGICTMSWKLTKKLKETHLGPLTSTFSRSPSTSTITTEKDDKSHSSLSGTATPTTENNIAASEALSQTPPVKTPKPGILVVTLHEGQGFSLPEQHRNAFSSSHGGSSFSTGNALGMAGSTRPSSASRTPGFVGGRPQTAGGFSGIPTNHGRISTKYMPYALIDFDKLQVFVNSVEGNPENPLWAGSNTQYKFDVSRVTELVVHLYIRNPNAPPGSGRSQDIFLGVVRINPRFEERQPYVEDPKASKKDREKAAAEHADRERALGLSGVEWVDVQYGSGKLKIGVEYVENRAGKLKIEDFELLKVVGKGSFGKVMQVRKKDTSRIYALKTIRKAHIISRSEVAHTLAERSVLAQINNPFIVPLKFTFQSPEKLYFVLAFVNGGELFHHLQKEQRFDVNRSRFYTAELLCALECLHGFNVIYRDLKPENILLDYQGHIALCDFGLCKLDMKDEDRTNTFCGTPEYLAPELLMGNGYNKTVDWWTLGVLLYEMLTGLPPFYDENTNEMYRKILSEPLHFPGHDVVPPAAKDLLTKLLNRDPQQRLGANGSAEIKAHPFFHAIDWRKLLQRKYEPAFKPSVVDALDTDQFDPEFTQEPAQDSYVEGPILSQTMQQQFDGFSYNRPIAGLGDAGGSIRDPSFVGSINGSLR